MTVVLPPAYDRIARHRPLSIPQASGGGTEGLGGARNRGGCGEAGLTVRFPLMFLPRIARALHHPGLAVALGGVLIVAGVIGFATGDMPKGWSILIVVVGVVNLLRGVVREDEPSSD